MKQNWQIDPVPPPETSAGGIDGLISVALVAFAIIGPLIYFGDELGTAARHLMGAYRVFENWLLPIRNWSL